MNAEEELLTKLFLGAPVIEKGENRKIYYKRLYEWRLNLINQSKSDWCIERDSIWMDSIAHCDILTNENIAEIKRAVSWHDKSNQIKDK